MPIISKKDSKNTVKKPLQAAKKPTKKSASVKGKLKPASKKPLARVKAIAARVQKSSVKPKPIGKVVHFFDNLNVAVLKVNAEVKIGETLRIEGGENTDFKQPIKSMQYNHQKITKAKKGQEFGLKVKERVREGYRVYKV